MTAPRRPLPRPMFGIAALVAFSAVALELLTLGAPGWLRIPVAVLWMLVIPGLPWALRLRLPDAGDTAVVAVAISMALAAIVGGGMALTGAWWPLMAVVVLAAQAVAAAMVPGLLVWRGRAFRRLPRLRRS